MFDRNQRFRRTAVLAVWVLIGLPCVSGAVAAAPARTQDSAPDSNSRSARFVENLGQWPRSIQYAAEMHGLVVRAECGALGFHAPASEERAGRYVRLAFVGARADAQPVGVEELPGRHHHYLGSDPAQWRPGARAFARIEYPELYPGVDLVVYAGVRGPKYDLHLERGVDPALVRVRWEGALGLDSSASGTGLDLGAHALLELPAVAWQPRGDGTDRAVEVRWAQTEAGDLVLQAPLLDPALPLVVDPEILWSTYLGSSTESNAGDWCSQVAVDPQGDVYVLGRTDGQDYPITPGAIQMQPGWPEWITVTRFRGGTGQVVFSAVFGGSIQQRGVDIAADALGRTAVVGWTQSPDFPVVAGSFDTAMQSFQAGFMTLFSPSGSELLGSTFLEGAVTGGYAFSCAVRADGRIVVAAGAGGMDFPTTPGALDTQFEGLSDAVLMEFEPGSAQLRWSTFLGGSDIDTAEHVEIGNDGHITVAGTTYSDDFPTTPGAYKTVLPSSVRTNFFVSRLSPEADQILWSTYLGGSFISEQGHVTGIAVDAFGTVTLGAVTNSHSYPTTPGTILPNWVTTSVNSTVLSRLSADGSTLLCSTFLTPGGAAGMGNPVVDASGVVTVLGGTGPVFPSTPGAYDEVYGPGFEYVVARIDPTFRRFLHLTHFGGPSTQHVQGIAQDQAGRVTAVGYCFAPGGYPTTPGSFQPAFAGGSRDGFATSFDLHARGVTPFGRSTHSCHGSVRADVVRSPASGAQDFEFYCSGAPEEARGVLLLGRERSTPHVFGGARIFVDLASPVRIVRVRPDAFGYVETPLPLPAIAPGSTFAAQYVFQNHANCLGTSRLSASNALRVVIQ